MARYLVLDIGCIECNFGRGDSETSIRMVTDDVRVAEASARAHYPRSDSDTIVIDSATGKIARVERDGDEFRFGDPSAR